MTEPGDEMAPDAAGGDLLHVSPVAREQVIRTLKAALTQGRLTEDEHDARAAQASASRSHAELTALTADLPAGLLARPPAARNVWAGVGVISAAVSVLATIVLLSPDNYLAFALGLFAAAALLVAPGITVGLMVDVRHRKRSGRQLPPGRPLAQACRRDHRLKQHPRWTHPVSRLAAAAGMVSRR